MSLRLKLIVALMLSGLASVALVGGVAYVELHRKFTSAPAQRARDHFRAAVADYFTRHGSWERGRAVEPFGRHRPPPPPPPQSGEQPPPPPPEDGREPPFRFILTDEQFRVLMGAGAYRDGEPLPMAAREHAEPVVVNGRTVAHVSTEGVLSPSKEDEAYLRAVREALIFGAAAAAALSVLLGVALGGGLSARLRRLTAAAQAMRSGDLHQQVRIEGGDEVATLAVAFNHMSAELAGKHESLKASHRTIVEQAEQLKELSIRDSLTDLYNRRHFDEAAQLLFEQCVRHRRPLAIVVADIDWFKRINDQFSHATGDAVLRQVAAILRTQLRSADVVARYGGEEFMIALPETPLPAAAALCDKLRLAIERFNWSEIAPELKVTMSLGLNADITAGSVAAMVERADQQLYRAKNSGRNRVCFA